MTDSDDFDMADNNYLEPANDYNFEMVDGEAPVSDDPTVSSLPAWALPHKARSPMANSAVVPIANSALIYVCTNSACNDEVDAFKKQIAALKEENATVKQENAALEAQAVHREDEFANQLSEAEDKYWEEKCKSNRLQEAYMQHLRDSVGPRLNDVARLNLATTMGITPRHVLEFRNLEVIEEEQKRIAAHNSEAMHHAHNIEQQVVTLEQQRATIQIEVGTLDARLNNLNVDMMQVQHLHIHNHPSAPSPGLTTGPSTGSNTGTFPGVGFTHRPKPKMPKFREDCNHGSTCRYKRCGYVHPAQREFFGFEIDDLPVWEKKDG